MHKNLAAIAWLLGWVWAAIAGVGGFVLLLHQGPWPITNGWFAMSSGIAACPLSAHLLKRYARLVVPAWIQFALALLIFMAGRIAVVVLIHRPFLPVGLMIGAAAVLILTVCLAIAQRDKV